MPRISADIVDNFSLLVPGARANIAEGARKVVLQGAQTLEGWTKLWIKQNGPYDRGNLRQSIHARLIRAENSGQIAATVASNAAYAEAAHEGQKPGHWPNVAALQAWVRRKIRHGHIELQGLEPGKKGVVRKRNQQIRTLAFLIGRKIHRQGTKGVPFFDIVYDESHKEIEQMVERGIVRLIRAELTGG